MHAPPWHYAIREAPCGRSSQDRVAVFPVHAGRTLLVVLADGAGGIAGGALAATRATDLAARTATIGAPRNGEHCAALLRALDREIATDRDAGECTAVLLVATAAFVYGASVGDSEAWHLGPLGITDLTDRQQRKPLLGSGRAVVSPFERAVDQGRVLVASDGVFKYALPDRLTRAATHGAVDPAATAVLEAVRLPSGALHDDVALVLLEHAR